MPKVNNRYIKHKIKNNSSYLRNKKRNRYLFRHLMVRKASSLVSSEYLLNEILKDCKRKIYPDEVIRATQNVIRSNHSHRSLRINNGGRRPTPKKDIVEGG